MLTFLFLFLTFSQIGLFGLGGNAGSQAFLEHEIITNHQWITPGQLADFMAICHMVPGSFGVNTAILTGYTATIARLGFGGAILACIISLLGLILPSFLWTYVFSRIQRNPSHQSLITSIFVLLRPIIPGLIIGAGLLMICKDNFGSIHEQPWDFWISLFLFLCTFIGCYLYRFNAVFMIIICGLAGCLLY